MKLNLKSKTVKKQSQNRVSNLNFKKRKKPIQQRKTMTTVYATKLNKLSNDYSSLLGNLKTGMENATEVAADLEESCFVLGQSAPEYINKLRDCMLEYQDMQLQLEAQRKCLDRLQLQVGMNGIGKEFYATFEKNVQQELEQYSNLTNTQKWNRFASLKEFQSRLLEIRGEEVAMDEDEDIQVVGHQVSLNCPFTVRFILCTR